MDLELALHWDLMQKINSKIVDCTMKKVNKNFVGIFCILFTNFIVAQSYSGINNKYYLWGNTGLQASSSNNIESLVGAKLGLNFSINQKHFLKLNAYGCFSPNDILASENIRTNRLINITNLSFSYGFSKYNNNYFIIIPYIGISYGNLLYRDIYLSTKYTSLLWTSTGYPQYKNENFNYIGLPLEVSLVFTKPIIGLGIDFYANFHKHSDYGITLNILIGKIRQKNK